MLATYSKGVILIIIGICVVSCVQLSEIPADHPATSTPLSSTKPTLVHIQVRIYGGGKPLRNVQVELYRNQFEPVPGELVQTGITNEQGLAEFEIEPGTYGFWMRALDMSAQWRYEGQTRFTFSNNEEIQVHMLPAY